MTEKWKIEAENKKLKEKAIKLDLKLKAARMQIERMKTYEFQGR